MINIQQKQNLDYLLIVGLAHDNKICCGSVEKRIIDFMLNDVMISVIPLFTDCIYS